MGQDFIANVRGGCGQEDRILLAFCFVKCNCVYSAKAVKVHQWCKWA